MRRTSRASIRRSSSSRCRTTRAASARARSCRRSRANLSDRDIRDLAAYYASLPKARTAPTTYDETLPALVRVGDPLRNIAPCISCHGGIDHKLGTPWLEGMPKEYLVAQLRAFKTGARRNDCPRADAQHGARDDDEGDRRGRRSSTLARPLLPRADSARRVASVDSARVDLSTAFAIRSNNEMRREQTTVLGRRLPLRIRSSPHC